MNYRTMSDGDMVKNVNDYDSQIAADFIRDHLPELTNKVYAMVHCHPSVGILFLQNNDEPVFLEVIRGFPTLHRWGKMPAVKSKIVKDLEDELLIREYGTKGSFEKDYESRLSTRGAHDMMMEAILPQKYVK